MDKFTPRPGLQRRPQGRVSPVAVAGAAAAMMALGMLTPVRPSAPVAKKDR